MNQKLYSIVVPVYEGEHSLKALCRRIDNTFENVEGDYEIILVDDGSSDNTWQIMKSLRAKNQKTKIIRLTRNYGQHNAIMCGFRHASGDYVITMDSDLQNPPEEIPKLIQALESSECDMVYGLPKKKQHPLMRNIASILNQKILSIVFKRGASQRTSSFRLIRHQVLSHILQDNTPNPNIGSMISTSTDRTSSIYVEHDKRTHGSTTYTIEKLVRHFLNGILFYSAIPLRTVSYLGLMSAFLSITLSCYYFIRYLLGRITVPGWTTVVLLLLFFSGMIMFSLGIIGEYLLRIIQEVRGNPQYLIREKEI